VRVLVLGGTLFLGRHVVEVALRRGHDVTLFNRGRTNPDLFPAVEKLRGDRDGDLSSLAGRGWDAAIDTSGYVPRIVRASAELLADAVEHYTFVSSLSVFTPPTKHGLAEDDRVTTIEDESSESVGDFYGPLKALCERVVESVLPERALVVRSGLLVGPQDPTNRFTYWVRRMAAGGEVLAPAPPEQPVQLADVRDLADWTIRMAEQRQAGTFHATDEPTTFRRMLDECRAAAGSDAHVDWIDETFLLEQGIEPFAELPLWLATGNNPDWGGFFLADASRARAYGLSFRPLRETARDILAEREQQAATTFGTGLTPAGVAPTREKAVLQAWRARAVA
jgi:2'-hydroxyisoflavone reductase